MLAATSTSGFGVETVYPVRPHDIAIVRGGGGSIQRVPFNIRGFGGLGALTDDDKNKLAQQVAAAAVSLNPGDVRPILATIADPNDRSDVATKAIALGGDARTINGALALASSSTDSALALTTPTVTPLGLVFTVIDMASVGISAYHGYKRNDSVGWAIVWGLLGGMFPILVPAIAFAQGLGERKSSGFGRRRRRRKSTSKRYQRRAR